MAETKKCPHCGGEIMISARKCKHCGRWLDTIAPTEKKETSEAVHSVSQSYQTRQGNLLYILLTVLGLLICGFVFVMDDNLLEIQVMTGYLIGYSCFFTGVLKLIFKHTLKTKRQRLLTLRVALIICLAAYFSQIYHIDYMWGFGYFCFIFLYPFIFGLGIAALINLSALK